MRVGKITEDKEKRRLVEEWDRSGLSSEAFGRARGIRGATLQAWGRAIRGHLRSAARTGPISRELELVEIGAPAKEIESRIEIVLLSGRRLVLFSVWNPDLIAHLVARLEQDR